MDDGSPQRLLCMSADVRVNFLLHGRLTANVMTINIIFRL